MHANCVFPVGNVSCPKEWPGSLVLSNAMSRDFADANPRSQVIGVDVSPIQPRWVPPNVEFEVDDITQEWTWQPGNFDFIYIRGLIGSIKDWKKLYREAYKCCKPGGWIESCELDLTICSDDGSVRDGMALVALSRCVKEAGRRMGRSSKDNTAPTARVPACPGQAGS